MAAETRGQVVGIDLGTTYSLVAALQAGGPVVLPNALGETLTPSAVSALDGAELLVGAPARARLTTHPERTAVCFKRDVGTERSYTLGARTHTPVELSAMVLRQLKEDAEHALGEPVERAVITVPAYFGERQRQATRDAGAIAGLTVERILNEPTAAAMAYGLHERGRELRAVVLDLGGGTFDVTVLEIIGEVIEIQASAGDARLGGEDFVDRLVEDAAARVMELHRVDPRDDVRALARLREACEQAKRRLSLAPRVDIVAPGLSVGGRSFDVELPLSRDQAELLWRPVLERIEAPITRALRDAGVRPEQIDEVLLVGGATRAPCVVRLAANRFGRMPRRTLPPDEAVAMGAAVQAALIARDASVEDLVVTDVAPFTLGLETTTSLARHRVTGLYSPVIDRGTTIPCSRSRQYFTVADLQDQITLRVYQGEHPMCRDNTLLGAYTVTGLPRRPAGEQGVDVRFTYDLNGLLEVEITVIGTERREHLVIEQIPGRLEPIQIEAAREAMAALKFHPRERLPNATAIHRAEALYLELIGGEREQLGAALAAFRAALEEEDAPLIEAYRDVLNGLIASHRRG